MSTFLKWMMGLVLVSGMAAWGLAGTFTPASGGQSGASSPTGLIEDPLILSGWQVLNGLTDPITLWDGRTLTGRELAHFLLSQQIPVQWGGADVCNGSSCSRLYCGAGGSCVYEDGQPGVDPIYLNPGGRSQGSGQARRVAAELAHEIFHRTQPFGQVKPSQYEEYWAFYLDAQISKSPWPDFRGVDPADSTQLEGWFTVHNLRGYLSLAAYPPGIQPAVELSVRAAPASPSEDDAQVPR